MAKRSKAAQAAYEAERAEEIACLRKLLPIGSKVFVKQSHVSRSGMMRHLSVYAAVLDSDGAPDFRDITHAAQIILDWPVTEYGELKVGGCGMDMHFHTVYSLASCVWRGVENETGPDHDAYVAWAEKQGKWQSTSPAYCWDKRSI